MLFQPLYKITTLGKPVTPMSRDARHLTATADEGKQQTHTKSHECRSLNSWQDLSASKHKHSASPRLNHVGHHPLAKHASCPAQLWRHLLGNPVVSATLSFAYGTNTTSCLDINQKQGITHAHCLQQGDICRSRQHRQLQQCYQFNSNSS
jgi:hypothetical protein